MFPCIVVDHASLKRVREAGHVRVCEGGGVLRLLEVNINGMHITYDHISCSLVRQP